VIYEKAEDLFISIGLWVKSIGKIISLMLTKESVESFNP